MEKREILPADANIIHAIFFDIDDTLFNTTEFSTSARKKALRVMRELYTGKDGEIRWSEKKLMEMINEILKEKGANYPRLFDEICNRLGVIKEKAKLVAGAVEAYHTEKVSIHPYPDVPRILKELNEKGYFIYAATDGIATKQWAKLIRMGLHWFFDDVFVSQSLRTKKEEKKFYELILRKTGKKPIECIMIGDREDKDIIPAKEAGFWTIRIKREGGKYSDKPKKTNADFVIRTLGELPYVLKKIREKKLKR